MSQYLINRALFDIWGAPDQESHLIYGLTPLTKGRNIKNTVTAFSSTYRLPTKDSRYYIYYLGISNPAKLGVTTRTDHLAFSRWQPIDEHVTNNNVRIDIYLDNGLRLPLHNAYTLYTRERYILFAIKSPTNRVFNLNDNHLYFRFYQNTYDYTKHKNSLVCYSETVKTQRDVTQLRNDLENTEGHQEIVVNGWGVHEFTLRNVSQPTDVHVIVDPSIIKVYQFKLSDLPVFHSALDNCYKYLLTLEGLSERYYNNDLDVYVGTQNLYTYYHRANKRYHRNVTHHRISLEVNFIDNLRDITPINNLDETNLYITVKVKATGIDRHGVYETNKQHELEKLPEEHRNKLLLSTDDQLNFWKASTLEASIYNSVETNTVEYLTPHSFSSLYGYNAIIKMIAPYPVPVRQGRAARPIVFHDQAVTLLHYNNAGLVREVELQEQTLDNYFESVWSNIEVITGTGSDEGCYFEGVGTVELEGNVVTIYESPQNYEESEVPVWEIVDNDNYRLQGTTLTRKQLNYNIKTLVKTDGRFNLNKKPLQINRGVYQTPLTYKKEGKSVVDYTPKATLNVIMNGYTLIEGVDYIRYNHLILILNKQHLHDTSQDLIVYETNDSALTDRVINRGFVERGMLSRDFYHQTKEDKVLKLIVGGQLKTLSNVTFDEDGVNPYNDYSGLPYMVIQKNHTLNAIEIDEDEAISLKEEAVEKDAEIDRYLTTLYPKSPSVVNTVIPNKYLLYSPFLATMLHYIRYEKIKVTATTENVYEQTKPHLHWLEIDPINPNNLFDKRFIKIHPHTYKEPITLNPPQYVFFKKIIDMFINTPIDDLDELVKITK